MILVLTPMHKTHVFQSTEQMLMTIIYFLNMFVREEVILMVQMVMVLLKY